MSEDQVMAEARVIDAFGMDLRRTPVSRPVRGSRHR